MVYNLRPRKHFNVFRKHNRFNYDEERVRKIKHNYKKILSTTENDNYLKHICTSKRMKKAEPKRDQNSFITPAKNLSKVKDSDQVKLNAFDDSQLSPSGTLALKEKSRLEKNRIVEIKVCNYFFTKKATSGNEVPKTYGRTSHDQGVQTDLKIRDLTNIEFSAKKVQCQSVKKLSNDPDPQWHKQRTFAIKKCIEQKSSMHKPISSTPQSSSEEKGFTDPLIIESDEECMDTHSSFNDYGLMNTMRDTDSVNISVLTPSNLSDQELDKVCKLAKTFGFRMDTKVTKWTSHLVISNETSRCTRKYLLGIASRCYIVKMSWVETCLEKNVLIPEDNFIPEDTGPRKCLNPMLSPPFKGFTVCTNAVKNHRNGDLLQRLSELCGAKVTRRREGLDDRWPKPRIYLFDPKTALETSVDELKSESLVPVDLHWIYSCISYYGVVSITPFLLPSMRTESLTQYGVVEDWHEPSL